MLLSKSARWLRGVRRLPPSIQQLDVAGYAASSYCRHQQQEQQQQTPGKESSPEQKIEASLRVFPEYRSAEAHFVTGSYQRAIPDYTRVLEVLTTAGSDPATRRMLWQVVAKLVRSRCGMNQPLKAMGLIQQLEDSHSSSSSAASQQERLHAYKLTAFCHIWQGQIPQAAEAASKGLELYEHLSHADVDLTAFSPLWTYLGMSCLLQSPTNAIEAEMDMQQAARWAQSAPQQVLTIGNLGACIWHRLATESETNKRFSLMKYRSESFMSEPQKVGLAKEPSAPLASLPEAADILQQAVQCWMFGLQELEQLGEGSGSGTSAAAAMCGPTGTSSSAGATSLSEGMNMTGLRDKELRRVVSPTAASEGDEGVVTLPDLLKDTPVAIGYAQLLCHLAEAEELLGHSANSATHLSNALKALTPHEADHRTNLLTARILRLIAIKHMNSAQFVTAEGLLVSMREKLASPVCAFDTRAKIELALADGCYGQLLCKWEKREQMGQQLRQAAQNTLQPWTAASPATSFPFTSLLLYPDLIA